MTPTKEQIINYIKKTETMSGSFPEKPLIQAVFEKNEKCLEFLSIVCLDNPVFMDFFLTGFITALNMINDLEETKQLEDLVK